MNKITFSLIGTFFCALSFGQVGVNTENANATFDITAKTNGEAKEGLLIPRLTGDQIQLMSSKLTVNNESMMIFATSAPTTPNAAVVKIKKPGYYFWSSNIWENVGGDNTNLYTADGQIISVSDFRDVNLNGKNLVFSGNGNLGIGTNTPSQKLEVAGSIKAFAIDYNSDVRLKKDVNALEKSEQLISKLKPVSYFWNETGKQRGGNAELQYGFIAQDVEKVLPNLVNTDSEAYKSVNYAAIIPLLTDVLQLQMQKIKALEEEVKLLKKTK